MPRTSDHDKSEPRQPRPVEPRCPCGRGEAYSVCCGPMHEGEVLPATAEQLMRSRFSAFALGRSDYLFASWHPSTRTVTEPEELTLDEAISWQRLFIEDVEAGGPFDTEGTVTFTAIGRTVEGRYEQRERSRFVREPGTDGRPRWWYLDGVTM